MKSTGISKAACLGIVCLLGVVVAPAQTKKAALSPAKIAEAKAASLKNLTVLASGFREYLGINKKFSGISDPARIQELVLPYIKSTKFWVNPNPAGGSYVFNQRLRWLSAKDITNPSTTVLLFDENTWPDGSRAVVFTDGKARFLLQKDWAAVAPKRKPKIGSAKSG